MKCAYEAANGVEAHMVANLLEQHSIASRIDGEYLAGGVGELPASGLVRVMVELSDYDRARQIIREWEAKSPPDKPQTPRSRSLAPAWFLFGLVVALAAVSWLYRSRAAIEGTDFNGDGRLDETYTYDDGRISKVEGDANLDGRVDYIYWLDSDGRPQSMQLDYDFDGRFEVKQFFERNNTKRIEIDWDLDGHVDRREDYVSGVLDTVTLYAPDGYRVVKRERFSGGKLIEAEFDSDGDGVTETLYRYDRYGEISECSPRATCEFRRNP
jgi:hypothetical protein